MKPRSLLAFPFLAWFLASAFCSSAFSQGEGVQGRLSPQQVLDNLAAKRYSGRQIDLVASNVGLREVIAQLEKAGGLRFDMDPSIKDKVTYRMQDIPWDEALAAVLSDNGLRIELDLEETGFKVGRGEKVILAFKDKGRARLVLFLYRHIFEITAGVVLLAGASIGWRLYRKGRARRGPISKKALLPAEAAEQAKQKLLHLLAVEKIYKDEDLTLQSLAERLAISPHQLSWVINDLLQLSFASLVNGYRVEEVKGRLSDPAFNSNSILQAALEAGFANKASFNRAFKKTTGMTPSRFKNSVSS